jgi:glycogen debranching enzyme
MKEPIATYVENPLVEENGYRTMPPILTLPPSFEDARHLLPQPFWLGNESAIDCYWKSWEIGFSHLLIPTPENGFVTPYLDTAFNGHLFMWDSAFAMQFGVYGCRAFHFQGTLDNLYAKQHPDGFICREIDEADGRDCFERFDPSSTGPNVLPWAEWAYYRQTGDRERLSRVFPALLAYTQWFRTYRTWLDGTYWSSGWGCGMDNMPRMEPGYHAEFSSGRMRWVDATLQAILSANILIKMAGVLGRQHSVEGLGQESQRLAQLVNEIMWDDETAFYYDSLSDGRLNMVKHIGAYWALLAEVVPPDQLERFTAHLDNPEEFNRPHRIPSLSHDHCDYKAGGGYWLGGVWAPTNYMVLKGLRANGYGALAHLIARNHLDNVVRVFEDTDTVWENYAPEMARPGKPAKPDFVGWTGLPAIAVLLEEVFGLQPDPGAHTIRWDVRLLDEHGVQGYPVGARGLVDLKCYARSSALEKPMIEVRSNVPVKLMIHWAGGEGEVEITA